MMVLNKPMVVSKLRVGDIIRLASGDIQITVLPDAYQHNTIASFKVATVQDVRTGVERVHNFYANMRYYVINRD